MSLVQQGVKLLLRRLPDSMLGILRQPELPYWLTAMAAPSLDTYSQVEKTFSRNV